MLYGQNRKARITPWLWIRGKKDNKCVLYNIVLRLKISSAVVQLVTTVSHLNPINQFLVGLLALGKSDMVMLT